MVACHGQTCVALQVGHSKARTTYFRLGLLLPWKNALSSQTCLKRFALVFLIIATLQRLDVTAVWKKARNNFGRLTTSNLSSKFTSSNYAASCLTSQCPAVRDAAMLLIVFTASDAGFWHWWFCEIVVPKLETMRPAGSSLGEAAGPQSFRVHSS